MNTLGKADRQKLILDVICKNAIETQSKLVDSLRSLGVDATQATVSRDLKELKITKSVMNDGEYAYAAESYSFKTETSQQQASAVLERLLNALNNGYISCDYASNIVVVKTIVGMAPPCALAIDAMKWAEVLGTIAGDDTIMIITRSQEASEKLVTRFKRLLGVE